MSTPPATAQQGALQASALAASTRPGQTVDVKVPLAERLRANPRLPLMLAAAAAVAALIVLVMWSRQPDYKVLFSNLSDRDGGAIITSLQQMNVPYKFAEGGGAILVPAESVNEMRLRLAQQGLPKGGSVGFELMDNQKFGISQFAEQINYQRSLEGELAQTIGAVSSVQSARVHLAIPKSSVFVREQQKPSASVMIDLFPGRSLSDGQVSAIVHLVATAVPDMPAANISVVDQNGDLLTSQSAAAGLDASQLKYIQQIEQNTRRRIEAILAPIYGPGNAHAQVSADIDFAQVEQTAETYQPNPGPKDAAVRSQQTSESRDSSSGGAGAGGVPGAMSNEPPANPTAPITNAGPNDKAKPGDAASGAGSSVTALSGSTHKDATINYELDRTIRHTAQPMGGVRRLTAAVVVNYRQSTDAKGKVTMQPVSAEQLAQTEALVKDAMGFDTKRGDTVNVVNSAFQGPDAVNAPVLPLWKQPEMIELAKQGGKYALIGIVGLYLFFGVLRPSIRKLLRPEPPPAPEVVADVTADAGKPAALTDGEAAAPPTLEQKANAHDRDLAFARQIAKQDPKVVATVVKSWISDER